MAGIQTIEEEFLTCSICMDIFTDPCTLSCGHSLCRKCVTQFIKTRPDAVQSRTIPCAFCRQVTPVPRPVRPVEEWAGQIRPSLILQELMDRHNIGHKHREGKDLCFQCKEVGETTIASSWCSNCEATLCSRCAEMHLKALAIKKHEVFGLSEGSHVKQRKKVKCKEHEGELIKFICKDCNKAVCQTCCLLKHAKHNFISVEAIVPEMMSALSEKRRIIEQKMKQNMTNVRNNESKIEELKNGKTRSQEQIKSETRSAITLIKQKEAELLRNLEEEYDKQLTEYQASVKSGQITNQMYQQYCEFIGQALQYQCAVDMYDMYQACLSGVVESVGSDTTDMPVIGEVKFTPNMEPLKTTITEMGEESRRGMKHGPNTMTTPVVHDTFDIKHRDDVADPLSNDITVLTVGGRSILVVADYSNKRLKSIDVINKIKNVLCLSKPPYRVAKMTKQRVVVTINNKGIVIAEVRPQLVLISDLKTKKQYHGITSLSDSTLAVGSLLPAAVDILDLAGNILQSFTPENSDLKRMTDPGFLCTTNSSNILISDMLAESVYCVTSNGDVVFTYKPTGDRALMSPQGITVTDTGDILLTDRKAQKIIHLTQDGTFVRDILPSTWHGTGAPWAMCFDNTGKLYMCLEKKQQNVIKVLRLK